MADKTFKYKGFIGSVEVSLEDNCLFGEVLHINDLVNYEADSPQQLEAEFRLAVDDYLDTCNELGIEPKKPASGSFNVRVEPALHQSLLEISSQESRSLNSTVAIALGQYVKSFNQQDEKRAFFPAPEVFLMPGQYIYRSQMGSEMGKKGTMTGLDLVQIISESNKTSAGSFDVDREKLN